ncbi:MAG TPA: ATP-binding protein [Verrucomicrobiae bacterium]|nr:ATP-binding protein [Verrucomicrobiae bacterium]
MTSPLEQEARVDHVELRIPCRAEWVALARLAASAVANRLKLTIEEIEDVKLAVAEACTAVIQHENHGEFIAITAEAQPGMLRLHVRDEGRHEPRPHPPSLDGDEARIAGLGVFIIRTLMDDVSYETHPERGTNLVLIKRLHG